MRKPLCFIIALFLALPPSPAPAAENGMAPAPRKMYANPDLSDKKYYLCKRDDQCVTAQLPCGRIVVVNTFTRDDVQGWYNFIGPQYKCLEGTVPQRADKIACVRNMCTADIRQVPTVLPDSPEARNPAYCKTVDDCAIVLGNCKEKIVVNKIYQQQMQKDYDRARRMRTDNCFWPDNRTVKKTTCEQNTCRIELEIPNQNHWSEPLHIEKSKGDKD